MSRLSAARLAFLSFVALSVNGAVCFAAGSSKNAASGNVPRAAAASKAKLAAPSVSRALPLVFEENAGQLPGGTAFAGRTANYTVQVLPSELKFGLPGKKGARTVTVDFSGSQKAEAVGVAEAAFRTNFYLGSDPRGWHTGVRNYNRVALNGLYPGINAEFYSTGSDIEHDFFVAAGSDASQLRLHLAGARTTTLSPEGDVVLSAEEGALKLKKPHAYQVMADGAHKSVEAEFVLASSADSSDLSFKLGDYDRSRELVIDPVITYATYVAGNNGSTPAAVASDVDGNVYLTGTTASTTASFGANAANSYGSLADPPATGSTVTFIARISRATTGTTPAYVNGSQIAWLTYYGDGTTGNSSVAAKAIAVVPGVSSPALYIAGQTNSKVLPGAAADANLSTGTSTYGFIAHFNSADGSANGTTYANYVDGGHQIPGLTIGGVDVAATPAQNGQATTLNAISVEANGDVSVAGSSTGTQYNGTSTLTIPSVPSDFCGAGLGGTLPKGLLATFTSSITAAPAYSTYVCGSSQGGAGNAGSTLSGISASTATANVFSYILAGATDLDFPMAGAYGANGYFAPASANTLTASAASIRHDATTATPANTVNWSYWSHGTKADAALGLTVDPTGTPSVVVFGYTSTPTFASASEVSSNTTPGAPPTTNTLSGYNTYNGSGQQVGFAVSLNESTGAFNGVSLLAGDGTSATSVVAASADGVGNVLLTGSTNGTKTSFPLASTVNGSGTVTGSGPRPATVSTLSSLEDRSLNPPTAGGAYTNGYLVRMPSTLVSADYVAFFGPASASGASAGVGVAVDLVAADSPTVPGILTTPPAYVLLNEIPGGSGSFTNSAAEEQVPQGGATHAAYLAQVGFVAPAGTASFTVGTSSANPTPVAYSTSGSTHVALSWTLNVGTGGTSQLTFNLPQSRYLSPYTAGQLSATVNGNEVSATDCTLGQVNASANPAQSTTAAGPGFTCVIPIVAPNMSGSTVVFTLSNATVTSAITPGTAFTVTPQAYDATGAGYQLPVSVATTGTPVLTVNVAATPGAVDAATSATQADAAGYPVRVTYTYTISNSSDYDSPQTKLVTNLNTTTPGTTLLSGATSAAIPAACDPTTAANGCDVPAHGQLKYTVTGVYLDQNFVGVSSFPYTVTQGVPTVSYSSPSTDAPPVASTDAAPSVQVNGTTTITANSITTNTPTYANGTSFQLGDQNVQLTASFTNTGNNLATSYRASVLLPQGYTAASSNCAAPTGLTTCTFSNIAAGQTVSFTITGSFNDTGTASDAVPPPSTASDPLTNAKASATSGTVTAKFDTLNTGLMGSTYVTSSALPAATPIKVTRVNALTYSITAKTPLASSTVNEYSPVHSASSNDQLTYTVNLRNGGISAARGIYISIPVPSSPSGTAPTVTLGASASSSTATANLLTCSTTSGSSPVVCYTNDLKAMPGSTTSTAIPQTYSLTFTVSYAETAVPQTVTTTQVTQGNGTVFAAADGDNSATGLGIPASVVLPDNTPTGSNVIVIQRIANIVSTVNVSAVGSAAGTSYADKTHITLDSNVPSNNSLPGVFDTALFQSSTVNNGINDAASLSIVIPIPGLTRVAVPQNCTLNGITGPTTTLISVSTATTMSCTTPASTTAAGGQTQQLRTGAGTCGAAPVPTGGALSAIGFDPAAGNCFQVAFFLKYTDSPTVTGTVVGANATATVSYQAATVTANDVDTPSTPAAVASAAVTTVQRAAHLRLMNPIAAPTYTTGAALGLDANGVAQAAEAQPHYDPVTRQPTTGKVYNCIRYALNVLNEGPNYVLMPSFSYNETPTTFVPTQYSVGTAAADASYVNCSTKTTTTGSTLPALAPYVTQNALIDGYYDLNSFAAPNNSGSATFATTGVAINGYLDSDQAGTTAGDFIGSRKITLVNTPANTGDASAFGIVAYGTTPQASLIFSNVSAAGITSAFSASTVNCTAPAYDAAHPAPPANVNICFPYGNSPVPKDAVPTRNLYQPGATPQYYQLPTTATVPGSAANNTTICFTMTGGPFLDTFVKPERVLLWVMANAGNATKYNSFPTGYSGFTSPLASQAGDVTTLVTPYLASGAAGSYTVAPASYTFPQIPQSQPNMVCGAVNGLTKTATAAVDSVAGAETFGVLEPVNFAPVTVAGSIAASSAVSKGSTSALLDIYLQRTSGSTLNTYDYDDRDPCYTLNTATNAISRQQCDDNPYLYEVTFLGANSTIGAVQTPLRVSTLTPENVAGSPAGSYHVASNINLSATTYIFVAVADQATGADSYSSDIANPTLAPNYGGKNPFQHQGDFLIGAYSVASGAQPPLCDPGNNLVGTYQPLPTQCNTVGGTSGGTPGYVLGGSKTSAVVNYKATPDFAGNYYLLGNVGDQSVNASGLAGTGLIPLPYPGADPTTTNPPNANSPATANISAGQTAGFAWLWLNGVKSPFVPGGAVSGDKYKLSCFQVDAASQMTAVAFSTGVTCSITTNTLGATNDPSVYTFADASGNNGSSYPVIYVSTSATTFAFNSVPTWKRAAEGIAFAMLFPVLFFRKRLGRGATLAALLVTLTASTLLTGCGSGGPPNGGGGSGVQTPAGRLYFRVQATPQTTTNGEKPIVSAPFIVSVQ